MCSKAARAVLREDIECSNNKTTCMYLIKVQSIKVNQQKKPQSFFEKYFEKKTTILTI